MCDTAEDIGAKHGDADNDTPVHHRQVLSDQRGGRLPLPFDENHSCVTVDCLL